MFHVRRLNIEKNTFILIYIMSRQISMNKLQNINTAIFINIVSNGSWYVNLSLRKSSIKLI